MENDLLLGTAPLRLFFFRRGQQFLMLQHSDGGIYMVRFSLTAPVCPGHTFLVETGRDHETPRWLLAILLRRLGGLGGQPVELLET